MNNKVLESFIKLSKENQDKIIAFLLELTSYPQLSSSENRQVDCKEQ